MSKVIEAWWVNTSRGLVHLGMEPASDDLAIELLPLMDDHFAEVDPLSLAGHKFRPDVDWYIRRAREGRLGVMVARHKGASIGYLIFRIDRSPISGGLSATEELWYVIPEQRGTVLARRMIEYFETVARHLGLAEIYMGYSKKNASALYERAGLQCLAVVYGKVLANEDSKVA